MPDMHLQHQRTDVLRRLPGIPDTTPHPWLAPRWVPRWLRAVLRTGCRTTDIGGWPCSLRTGHAGPHMRGNVIHIVGVWSDAGHVPVRGPVQRSTLWDEPEPLPDWERELYETSEDIPQPLVDWER